MVWKGSYIAYHCGTLGKSFNLHVPHFPHLQNEIISVSSDYHEERIKLTQLKTQDIIGAQQVADSPLISANNL